MLNAVGSETSAASRYDATANNVNKQETREARAPASDSASSALGGSAPTETQQVEETASASRGPAASLRSTTPSYLTTLDLSSDDSKTASDFVSEEVSTEATQEIEAKAQAAEAEATERSQADQRALQAANELVRKLYDLQ